MHGEGEHGQEMDTTAQAASCVYRLIELQIVPDDQVIDERFQRYPFLLTPFLQGVIMESIDPKLASELHQSSINPYSQYITNTKTGFLWRINALNQKASEGIVDVFANAEFNSIKLRSANMSFSVTSKRQEGFPLSWLTELFYCSLPCRRFQLCFLAPTAFKQQGGYIFMPEISLILHSLQQKYSAIHEDSKEVDPEMLADLSTAAYITSYKLQSQYFRIGETRIPAFVGSIQIAVKGAPTLQNYVHMLLRFGELSGVGIKTSMGMGAFAVKQHETMAAGLSYNQ